MDHQYNKVDTVVDNIKKASEKKKDLELRMIIVKAILAGAFIALGAAGSSAAVYDISNYGLAKLLAGAIFPTGLILVVTLGAELFTGDCLMAFAWLDKRITNLKMLRILGVAYIGNFIGALLITTLVYYSGQLDYTNGKLGAYAISVALGKIGSSPVRMIISGILCNMIVCLAVMVAGAAKDITGKILAMFFPILIFVIGGYEHCVANMYYISMGLLAKHNTTYVLRAQEIYGVTKEQLTELNVGSFITENLIPVTLGNIIGGIILVAMPLFYISRKRGEKE